MQRRKGYYNRKQAKINVGFRHFMITGTYSNFGFSNRTKEMSRKGLFDIVGLKGKTETVKELMLEAASNRRYPYDSIKKRLQ